jgi:transcriptional regulator with XRE-family HTH domain
MTLDQYIAAGNKTAEQIADATGLTPASISRIRRGLQKPSFDAIRAIVSATEGQVGYEDLLGEAA